MTKRLRVFGGPNGSGKTTLIEAIKNKFSLGIYINPDDIEKDIKSKGGYFDFTEFNINLNKDKFKRYIKSNTFYNVSLNDVNFNQNSIQLKEINSYIASLLSGFIREELLHRNKSFSFETVMSSKDKVEFLKRAKEIGFKTYLRAPLTIIYIS